MNFFKFAASLVLLLFASTILMADLTDGLVAYWPLNSNTKDAVGNHDGKLGSGAKLIDDPERGKVLDVSANNGNAYMEVAHSDDIGFVDPATRTFTISLSKNGACRSAIGCFDSSQTRRNTSSAR